MHEDVSSDTQQVCEVLAAMGQRIKAPETRTKKIDSMHAGKKAGVGKKSYNGNACQAWHDAYMQMINVAHPLPLCTPGSIRASDRQKAIRTWSKYLLFWNFIKVPLDYGCPESEAHDDDIKKVREEAARKAETLAREFVEEFCENYEVVKSWYFHAMVAHVPDNIRRFGWLGAFATYGIEGVHKRLKSYLLNLSNSIPGQRLHTVLTHICAMDEALAALGPEYARYVADEADKQEARQERRRATTLKRVKRVSEDIVAVRATPGEGSFFEKITTLKNERELARKKAFKRPKKAEAEASGSTASSSSSSSSSSASSSSVE